MLSHTNNNYHAEMQILHNKILGVLFYFVFDTEYYKILCVSKNGPDLLIFLPLLPRYQTHRCEPSCQKANLFLRS